MKDAILTLVGVLTFVGVVCEITHHRDVARYLRKQRDTIVLKLAQQRDQNIALSHDNLQLSLQMDGLLRRLIELTDENAHLHHALRRRMEPLVALDEVSLDDLDAASTVADILRGQA